MNFLKYTEKNLSQYDRLRVLGYETVDGVLVVLSSNHINIATFAHQMGDVCTPPTVLYPSTPGLSYWPKFFKSLD